MNQLLPLVLTALAVGGTAVFVVPRILDAVRPNLPEALVRNRWADVIIQGLAFMAGFAIVGFMFRLLKLRGRVGA